MKIIIIIKIYIIRLSDIFCSVLKKNSIHLFIIQLKYPVDVSIFVEAEILRIELKINYFIKN